MRNNVFFVLISIVCFSSCRNYNQNIIFKTKDDKIFDEILHAKLDIKENYKINPNDRLQFQVFSNDGQEIKWIPAFTNLLMNGNSNNRSTSTTLNNQPPNLNNNNNNTTTNKFNSFLVQVDGTVQLPMIGSVLVEGKTINQVDSLMALNTHFGKFFKGCFVKSACVNNRVIILKGQQSFVLQLNNENISLIEAIALSGGIPNNVRATNIRLIRGDLKNPNVYKIDLSRVEGIRRMNLTLRPNDIIYLEPIRKTFLESIRDYSPLLGLGSSIATLITTIILLNKK